MKRGGRLKTKRPTADARRAEESARLKVWARASQPHGIALCEVCGERAPTNYQHRKARSHCSKDELWAASNGLAVCGDGNLPTGCHGKRIHLEPLAAKAAGWICESWLDPRDKPVLRFGEWCLLNDDGGFEPVERGAA